MQFHESYLGKQFFSSQLPQFLESIGHLSLAVEKQNELYAKSLVAQKKTNEMLEKIADLMEEQLSEPTDPVDPGLYFGVSFLDDFFGGERPNLEVVKLPEDYKPITLDKNKNKDEDGEHKDE